MARLGILHRNRTADEDATQTVDRTDTRPVVGERRPTEERTVVDKPVERPVEPVEQPAPRFVRVSMLATFGLVVGLVALAATLTGLLAPVGAAVGVLSAGTCRGWTAVPTRSRAPGTGSTRI
ncbi:MAG: hypothetical protein AUI14_04745 [Actinobacteria bacterium 13_2_20CM_2_71_6]|nr:MAG: hypothetical protein AUI14_04745 [Actinobacteria bacterium 13_2_20CM_2_71_6]